MRVTVRGKRWNLVFTRLKKSMGTCDAVTVPNKKIRVSNKLKGVRLLDTIIHELMHAGMWDLDEECIHEVASDIAKTLWKLGYRLEDGGTNE